MEVSKAPEYEVFERWKASIKAESLNQGEIFFHLNGLFLGRINSPNPPLKKGLYVCVLDLSPQVILLQTKT